MRIERLDLIAFGHITDVSLDFSAQPRQFHLVYGPNESGKSTSMRAISSWLFGMPTRASDNFLHPNAKLRVGGLLSDEETGALECIRRRGQKATLRDADDSEPVDETRLQSMLAGIDQNAFETRFSISHDELLRGGEQILKGQGDLGEILFSAGAGVSRLRDVQQTLLDDAGALFKPRGKTKISENLSELKTMRAELSEAQVPPAEFASLRSQMSETEERIVALKEKIVVLDRRLMQLHNMSEALPLVPRWKHATEQLKKVANVPKLAEDFSSRRRKWEEDRAVAEGLRLQLQKRKEELTQQLDKLDQNTAILQHESEIEAVFRDLPIREKAETDRNQLKDSFGRTQRRMRDRLRDISQQSLDPVSQTANDDVLAGTSDPMGDVVDSLYLSETQRLKVQRLAQQSEKLYGLCEEANQDINRIQAKLESLAGEPGSDSKSERSHSLSPDLLEQTLHSVPPCDHLIKQLRDANSAVERASQKNDSLLRDLGFPPGHESLQAVVALVMPTPEQVEPIKERLDNFEEAARLAATRLTEANEELEQAQEQLQSLHSDMQIPTIDELEEARQRRDLQLDGCKDAKPARRAEMLTQLAADILQVDQISDLIRTHHEDVHRRQTAMNRLQEHQQRVQLRADQLDQQQQQLAQCQEHWVQLWQAIDVQAESPPVMERFVQNHRKLVEAYDGWRSAQCLAKQAESEVEQVATRLKSAVEVTRQGLTEEESMVVKNQGDDDQSASLVYWHDCAVSLRHQVEKIVSDSEGKNRLTDRLKEEFVEAESTLRDRQQAVAKWQAEWDVATESLQKTFAQWQSDGQGNAVADNRAVQGIGGTPTVSPGDAMPVLDAILDLHNQKRERDILRTRINSIDGETRTYLKRTLRLLVATEGNDSAVLEEALSTLTPLEQLDRLAGDIQSLYQRLQKTRSLMETKSRLQTQLDRCLEEVVVNDEHCQRLKVTSDQLCREAETSESSQLPELEAQAEQRHRYSIEARELESRLTQMAGTQTLDDFLASLDDSSAEAIGEENSAVQMDKDQLAETLAQTQKEFGKLEHQYQAIDGSEKAARLSQNLQFCIGGLSRNAEEYIRLQLAAGIMRRAVEHYRDKNQEPILKDAERNFATLTCQEYTALKVDYDSKGTPTLIGVRSTGDVSATEMSTGTADALYLAMRLASLQHQVQTARPMPLIVDDCLIQLDDERAAAALSVFSEVSETTQVILFTHHEHLLELASNSLDSDCYHVHKLPENTAFKLVS